MCKTAKHPLSKRSLPYRFILRMLSLCVGNRLSSADIICLLHLPHLITYCTSCQQKKRIYQLNISILSLAMLGTRLRGKRPLDIIAIISPSTMSWPLCSCIRKVTVVLRLQSTAIRVDRCNFTSGKFAQKLEQHKTRHLTYNMYEFKTSHQYIIILTAHANSRFTCNISLFLVCPYFSLKSAQIPLHTIYSLLSTNVYVILYHFCFVLWMLLILGVGGGGFIRNSIIYILCGVYVYMYYIIVPLGDVCFIFVDLL